MGTSHDAVSELISPPVYMDSFPINTRYQPICCSSLLQLSVGVSACRGGKSGPTVSTALLLHDPTPHQLQKRRIKTVFIIIRPIVIIHPICAEFSFLLSLVLHDVSSSSLQMEPDSAQRFFPLKGSFPFHCCQVHAHGGIWVSINQTSSKCPEITCVMI